MTKTLMSRDDSIDFLLDRDGNLCYICEKKLPARKEMTFDHFIPTSKGGPDILANKKLTHKKCNAWKGDRMPNPDGTIPPKPASRRERILAKKTRPEICQTCHSGRLIPIGMTCHVCGSGPMPAHAPQAMKQKANECSHSGPEWCWACSIGIAERKPAIETILEG